MAFIDKGFTNEFRLSSCPQPILPGKHTLNPAIVTVIGAGVAGLTVAHELVERGFLVQVVEATPDPFHPGRPIVGGMAANQPARVRANIEDLHGTLLDERRPLQNHDAKKIVIDWLMWIFALNRTRWIPTEDPDAVPRVIIDPTDVDGGAMRKFLDAKKTYRRNWLWDLIVRPFLMGAVTSVPPSPPVDADGIPNDVIDIFKRWCAEEATDTIVRKLHEHMRAGHDAGSENTAWPIKVPTRDQLDGYLTEVITPAFDREFLCFRLIPRAVPGSENAEAEARHLFKRWRERFEGSEDLKHCFMDSNEAGQFRRNSGSSDIRVVPAREPVRAGDGRLVSAWLQVEVLEQRIPGEHGYRFFPSSYRHLDNTMKRIPLFDEAGRPTGFTVFDNLRPTVFQGLGMTNDDFKNNGIDVPAFDPQDPAPVCSGTSKKQAPVSRVVEIHRNRATSVEGLRDRTDRFVKRLGGTPRDAALFGLKMLHYMSSCPERRRAEYEKEPWSSFIGLSVDEEKGGFSKAMKLQMNAAAQALLAFSVGEADARTYGDTATQLFLDQLGDGSRVNRTLNGPTSSAWLEPWRVYLQRQGVRFFCAKATSLEIVDGELVPVFGNSDASVDYWDNDRKELLVYDKDHPERSPDFYVLALGLPQVAELLKTVKTRDSRAAAAEEMDKVIKLHDTANKHTDRYGNEDASGIKSLKDMTGVQFFFDAKTSIGDGHMYFPFSPWGLSSISQNEFWLSRGGFSDGYLGVLSVDICTTDKDVGSERSFLKVLGGGRSAPPGIDRDDQITRGSYRVARQVWEQIKARISAKDELAEPKCFHLDRAIASGVNTSQYLAATPQLRDRPGRRGGDTCVGEEEIGYELFHKRWVMCGTYMATHTRMTTMEAANESGRHAVRAILHALGNDDKLDTREQFEVQTPLMKQLLIQFNALGNKTYNTAWANRKFDPPDVWSPEDNELEDLDLLRRIDRRLVELGLPHCFKILKVEEKMRLAHMTRELYGKDAAEPVDIVGLLGLSAASVDAKMTKELGEGYSVVDAAKINKPLDALKALVEKAKTSRFPDMRPQAVDELQALLDKLTKKA